MKLQDEFKWLQGPQKAALTGLALVSAAAWGSVAYMLIDLEGLGQFSMPVFAKAEPSYRPVQEIVRPDVPADQLMARILEKSQGGLVVVLVAPPGCGICAEMNGALAEARYRLRDVPLSSFIIDPATQPEVAAQVGHRPGHGARLYSFYQGEKIHESLGVSERVSDLTAYLDGVFNLAIGAVSHLDRFQPAPR
jgi:hypothetical protein